MKAGIGENKGDKSGVEEREKEVGKGCFSPSKFLHKSSTAIFSIK